MDEECQKIIAEKEATIRQLQERVRELEMKLRSYEIRDVYRGILPDDVLEELVKLPPDQMVIEIGKYLKKSSISQAALKERNEKISKIKEDIEELKQEVGKAELSTEATLGIVRGAARAKVGVDLTFAQKYDYEGSDFAFLAEDIMKTLNIKEGEYVTVKKNGSVNLRILPYSKEGFIIVPAWVREKIGVKVNEYVEVVSK